MTSDINWHFREFGSKDGIPVLFLHGGPGSRTRPEHRRYFDPDFYRIVLFDQRGCGRSTPPGCTEDNTLWHLLEDMESIRRSVGAERWLLFGGSWGSTLALAYAATYPQRVAGMILRGVFLASSFITNNLPREVRSLYASVFYKGWCRCWTAN